MGTGKYHRSMTLDDRERYDELARTVRYMYSAIIALDREAKQVNPYHVRRFYSRAEKQARQLDTTRTPVLD